MGIKVTGFDEVINELSKLQKNAENLKSENSIDFSDLFNKAFLSKHSSFTSYDDLVEKSPFTIKNSEDFEAIPDDEWEKFITENTDFSSWEAMQVEAAEELVANKLGF